MGKFLSGNDFLYIGLGAAAVYAAYKLTKPVTDLAGNIQTSAGGILSGVSGTAQSATNLTSGFLDQIHEGMDASANTQNKFYEAMGNFFTGIGNIPQNVGTAISGIGGNNRNSGVNQALGAPAVIALTPSTQSNLTQAINNLPTGIRDYWAGITNTPQTSASLSTGVSTSYSPQTVTTRPPQNVTSRTVTHVDARGVPYTITYSL